MSHRTLWLQFFTEKAVRNDSTRIAHVLYFVLLRRLSYLCAVFPIQNFVDAFFGTDTSTRYLFTKNC